MEVQEDENDPVIMLRNLYPQITNPKPREKRRMYTNYLVQKYSDRHGEIRLNLLKTFDNIYFISNQIMNFACR